MDPAAEDYSVAYSMKIHKNSTNRPSRSDKKSEAKSRKSSKGTKNSKGKPKNLDINEIKQSLSTNCCACCCVLAAYMKEAGKLVSSCLNEHPTDTKLCELFSELVSITCIVGNDCYNLICYFFRLLFVINDKKRK